MKRKALWITLVLVVVAVAATVAGAGFKRGHGWHRHGWHRGGPLAHVARELNMSKAQIAQTRAIALAERPTAVALLRELLAGAHQIADATVDGTFDEAKVRAIAATEGDTFAKLLVEKERLKSQIYAQVLNETQRKSADEMQQRWLGRLDHVASRMQGQIQ